MSVKIGLLIFICASIGIVMWRTHVTNQFSSSGLKTRTIYIGKTGLEVEIADTPTSQTTGLAGRASLKPNHGMYFLFPSPQMQSFWMKDMHFGIDIIWIRDHRVVQLSPHITPLGNGQPIISPKIAVDSILEVQEGFVEKNAIMVGERVED